MDLKSIGWNSFYDKWLSKSEYKHHTMGRVVSVQKNNYYVLWVSGELIAKVSGAFIHRSKTKSAYPVTGDWVAMTVSDEKDSAVIHTVLPRINKISRNTAGGSSRLSGGPVDEQLIGANINTIFIVTGLDRDFNLRRIERYLTLVYNSEATPVIVLNKKDLCPDPEKLIEDVRSIALGVPVYAVAAEANDGLSPLLEYMQPGQTAALLGSSGAGKSTIINTLLGHNRQKVHKVSDYAGKGMHTTTHRELIILPSGGLIMDNPGMRELQLWDDHDGLTNVFEDIENIASRCRFSDCSHENEPGCAVMEALNNGAIDPPRVNSYLKLKKELNYISKRKQKTPAQIEKETWKKIRIMQKDLYKNR